MTPPPTLPPGVRGPERLGPAERLRHRNDFAQLRRGGRRASDDVISLVMAPNGLAWSRVASAVPKRAGKAVVRNRLRRLYRAAFRLDKLDLPRGFDILVSPRKGATDPDLETVRASLASVSARIARRLARAGDPR